MIDESTVMPDGVAVDLVCTLSIDTSHNTSIIKENITELEEKRVKKNFTWNCLGDSITAPEYASLHYYDYISDRIGGITVRNYGISGTRITATGQQSENAFCNRYNQMEPADVITVFGGVNDWGQTSSPPPILGQPDDNDKTTFYGALNVLCEGLKKAFPSSVILFLTPLGNDGYPGCTVYKNIHGLTVENYIDAIIDVCGKYVIPVVDLYRYSDVSPYDAEQNQLYFIDGLHLNNEGQLQISYLIEDAIRKHYLKGI